MSKLYLGDKFIIDPDVKLEKVKLTQAEYDALTDKKDNILYVITDAPNPYSKIVEVDEKIKQHIEYNNTENARHIPAGGDEGQILRYDKPGGAKWGTLTELNDYYNKSDIDTLSNTINTKVDQVQSDLTDHKENKDLQHIPSGGSESNVLVWDGEGKAKWGGASDVLPGLTELLAYGVEWQEDVEDPHLTRIGNMSKHKTLPIQSQLKGCIAQGNKVIYWLDENDWRFRKDPNTITVTNVRDNTCTVSSVEGLGINQYLRKGTTIFKIIDIDADSSTITVEAQTSTRPGSGVQESITTGIILEVGSRLDGYDGTVRVYCPNFYIKSQAIGNTRRVWLCDVNIDNTWTFQPEILIDAYKCTILNTVPENMGYLSTLPVNSAVSIVNTSTYCRGGNNRSSYDVYLTSDACRTDLGKPITRQSTNTSRIQCRNAGNNMLSYDQYKNIFYWLYVVEYANFNCHENYNSNLTEEGYHQGGLGLGLTDMSYWGEYNNYFPITPCGYGNSLGNKTGLISLTIPEFTYGTENLTKPKQIRSVTRWRGFDNIFGDILTSLDGVIIDADVDNHSNGMCYVYTCNDPSKYSDTLNDGYKKVIEVGFNDGYSKSYNLSNAAHIISKTSEEIGIHINVLNSILD